MKKQGKKRSRGPQFTVYVSEDMQTALEREAQARHRKISPTVLEILREYFEARKNVVPESLPTSD